MLPVAGISGDVAHDILTGLRAAAAAAVEEQREKKEGVGRQPPSSSTSSSIPTSSSSLVPERWLDALLLSQLAADALHRDAERARRALAFWRRAAAEGSGSRRATGSGGGGGGGGGSGGSSSSSCLCCSSSWNRGSHCARLLLRSGPREAFRGLGRGASSLAQKISSLVKGKGGQEEEEEEKKHGAEGDEKGRGAEVEDGDDPAAAVDLKTKELALLCSELERALARVHASAALLRMEKRREVGKERRRSFSPCSPAAVLAAAEAAAESCCLALVGALSRARAAPLSAAAQGSAAADSAALSRGTRGGLRLALGSSGGSSSSSSSSSASPNVNGNERPSSAAAARSAASRPASAPLPPLSPIPSPPSSSSSSEAAIEAAKEALGISRLPSRVPGRTRAPEALAAVTSPVVVQAGSSPAAAVALPTSSPLHPLLPISPLPEHLRPPSWLQQRWLLVALAAAGGGAAVCLLARRCRFLGGDGSFEKAVSSALENVVGALDAHVVEPLASLRAEMFSTLRDRRAIVTNEEFLAETRALERMLADFDRDVSSSSSSDSTSKPSFPSSSSPPSPSASAYKGGNGASAAAAAAGAETNSTPEPSPLSMARLMRTYEEELRYPVKNLLSGHLARCLLIQLQKVKVDSSSALLEMDQVLRANELSLAATAAVPALAAVWVLGIGAKRLFFGNRGPPPDPRRAAAPLRSAFADAEDALVLVAAAEEEAEGGGRSEEEEREELAGRALVELSRALAAVDALLGLRPPPSRFFPASFFFRFLPNPARAVGELEHPNSSSSTSSPSVEVLPVVGGVLASRSWRAGDAARCRAKIVELASPSLPAAARAEAAARLARSSALFR